MHVCLRQWMRKNAIGFLFSDTYTCSKLSTVTWSLLTWVRQSCGFVAISGKKKWINFIYVLNSESMHITFNNLMYYYKNAILPPEDQPHFRLRFLGLLRRSKNRNISEWCSTPGLVLALTYCYILLQWSQCACRYTCVHVYVFNTNLSNLPKICNVL